VSRVIHWYCKIHPRQLHIFVCSKAIINTLNAKFNPICHLLALLGAHHILHISRIRVNLFWKEISSSLTNT
jgi:hypothetical protein